MDNLPKFDSRIQTEDIAFDAAEMIVCGGCRRTNPPDRLKCIYCGAGIEVDADRAATLRQKLPKLDVWESGYNLILGGKSGSMTLDTAKIANFLSIDPSIVTALVEDGSEVPLARVETEKDAAVLQTGLTMLGLESFVVSDRDLAPDRPPIRLGTIQFLSGCLTVKDFNTARITQINSDDLALVVPGLITQSRVDSLEEKGPPGQVKGNRRNCNNIGRIDRRSLQPT